MSESLGSELPPLFDTMVNVHKEAQRRLCRHKSKLQLFGPNQNVLVQTKTCWSKIKPQVHFKLKETPCANYDPDLENVAWSKLKRRRH